MRRCLARAGAPRRKTDAGPANRGSKRAKISDQRDLTLPLRPVKNCPCDTRHRKRQTKRADRCQPVVTQPQMRAKRHPNWHGIKYHRRTRDIGQIEGDKQKHKLDREKSGHGQKPAPGIRRDRHRAPHKPHDRPKHQECPKRPQTGREHWLEAAVDHLDNHIVERQKSGKPGQRQRTGGVNSIALLHQARLCTAAISGCVVIISPHPRD